MGNWDVLESELQGKDFGRDAGEWAVTALACVAFADGKTDERELDRAREIVAKVAVIRDSLGPVLGEQIFLDTVARLGRSPVTELEAIKDQLRDLAGRVTSQEHRDHAFQALISIATADHDLAPSEHRLLTELRNMIGSTVIVPLPLVLV
jgi:uncharacterized tellurite resistance protein B-like protein